MTLSVDLYWSFRSPYSYLVTGRVVQLAAEYDVTIALKLVYPLAVRVPDYYAGLPPQRRAYFRIDPKRVGDFLGIPYAAPDPDPLVIDPQTRRPAAAQPHIRRLTHLGIEAVRRGRGLAFVDEVSKLIWSGAVRGWHEGEHLGYAARRAGLELAQMEAAVAADPAGCEAELERNGRDLDDAGHWGVPTFVVGGEPFFGQDRFDLVVWRLKQQGLERRAAR